jgi:ATP-dependent Lon protease
MFAAVTSLLLRAVLRPDVAVIGEITLRGRVLPISGIKDKVLAGHRAGIRAIVLPRRNEPDLIEVPEEVRGELAFHFVEHVREVLPIVLEPPDPTSAGTDQLASGDEVRA